MSLPGASSSSISSSVVQLSLNSFDISDLSTETEALPAGWVCATTLFPTDSPKACPNIVLIPAPATVDQGEGREVRARVAPIEPSTSLPLEERPSVAPTEQSSFRPPSDEVEEDLPSMHTALISTNAQLVEELQEARVIIAQLTEDLVQVRAAQAAAQALDREVVSAAQQLLNARFSVP